LFFKHVFTAAIVVLMTASSVSAAGSVIDAIRNGDREAVRVLLKQRANVNASEADGTTALHWAVRVRDGETTRLLIRAGANVKAANRYGITPLSLAATNGDATAIDMLIKAGADPNVALPDGETILMTAARTGDAASVKILLTHGANVDAKDNTLGQTALMWAASQNHAAAVKVLIEGGADVNLKSAALNFPPFKWGVVGMVSTVLPKGSWPPLFYAARENSIDAARALIDAGAEVNATDTEGSTPLLIAILNAHYDMAAALLERGADPNQTDQTGTGPLYAVVDMHTMAPMVGRPSPKPSGTLEPPDIVTLLLDKGANPNAALRRPAFGKHHDLAGDASMGEGTTPLMRAARTGDVEVMRILLARGANPAARRKDLATAIHLAATGRGGGLPTGPRTIPGASNLEAVKMLAEAGLDVNAFNGNGQTPLHVAAQRGQDEMVTALIDLGAELTLRDKQKRTPLDLAMGVGLRGRNPEDEVPVRESTVALLRDAMTKRGIPVGAAADRPAAPAGSSR
jgi:ankyrin repeat protein